MNGSDPTLHVINIWQLMYKTGTVYISNMLFTCRPRDDFRFRLLEDGVEPTELLDTFPSDIISFTVFFKLLESVQVALAQKVL